MSDNINPASTDVNLAVSYVCVCGGGGGGGRGDKHVFMYLHTCMHVLSMDVYCRCY